MGLTAYCDDRDLPAVGLLIEDTVGLQLGQEVAHLAVYADPVGRIANARRGYHGEQVTRGRQQH